ncbi:MAG: transposase [Ignavibacteria bacterium]|nr:transposase [Ignavibacteria bacterium]
MLFIPGNIYHVYNRGNNREPVFYQTRNYDFFLSKAGKHINKFADIISYCLVPNHFHFMIKVKEDIEGRSLNNEFAVLLRSYTRAINAQEGRTGSLFQQKTKAKNVSECCLVCFNYIHQNPLKAGIVQRIEDWEYSSFNEYAGKSRNPICNIQLGKEIIEFNTTEEFYKLSYQNIDPKKRDELY